MREKETTKGLLMGLRTDILNELKDLGWTNASSWSWKQTPDHQLISLDEDSFVVIAASFEEEYSLFDDADFIEVRDIGLRAWFMDTEIDAKQIAQAASDLAYQMQADNDVPSNHPGRSNR